MVAFIVHNFVYSTKL